MLGQARETGPLIILRSEDAAAAQVTLCRGMNLCSGVQVARSERSLAC